MRFVKMHGIGNDYVYIDAYSSPEIESHFGHEHGQRLVRDMSHRHTGVGSDGVILVCRPTVGTSAHVRMRMFNADGSESEMCGNGVRCVAKFAHDRLGVTFQPLLVETGRGVLTIDYDVDEGLMTEATVDMGEPILAARDVPVCPPRAGSGEEPVVGFGISGSLPWEDDGATRAAGIEPHITCVSMGNPHVVLFCANVDALAGSLARLGPLLEHHAMFPRRVNVHFVQVMSRARARMITWERGAGATLACGTGACAVLVAGVLNDRLDRDAVLELPGGELRICWDGISNHVLMTGPAADVFEGEWPDY